MMLSAVKTSRFNAVEITLVVLGVVALYLLLALFAPGGPLSTDVIWYANVALNGIKDPFILDRYFDVFLQAIFLKIAPSPLIGIQHYWAFLIAVNCGLIYLAARLVSKKSWVIHGLLAVAIFVAISDVIESAGTPLVDIPAMLMVILMTIIFMISSRQNHRSNWLIGLIGFLLYLAFRTKETTLPAVILLFGLGMSTGMTFNWRLLFKRLAYVLLGVMAGMVFFIFLNTIFVHDPLFGFRPADIISFIRTYVSDTATAVKQAGPYNWYTGYLFTTLLIPFVLYMISAINSVLDPDAYPGIRLVYLIPLAVIVFITITVGNQWGFVPRYTFTAIPLLCMLAPQFINLGPLTFVNKREVWQEILVLGLGLVFILAFRLIIRSFITRLGWDTGTFLNVVFIPILLSILLAIVFYFKQPTQIISTLVVVLILGIISVPLGQTLRTIVLIRPNQNAAHLLFYPYSAFSDQIHYSPDMQMYISMDAWKAVRMSSFAKDRTEVSSLFNLYFNTPAVKTNFALSSSTADIPIELLSHDFNYALLSQGNWNEIEKDPSLAQQIEKKYQATHDPQNLLVLLTFK